MGYRSDYYRKSLYIKRQSARAKPFGMHIVCNACGRDKNEFHDSQKCAEAWLKKCDEEAAKAREGSKP